MTPGQRALSFAHESGVLRGASSSNRRGDRVEHRVRRRLDRAWREHEHEVDPERRPVDLAEIGDLCREAATGNIHRDLVADRQAESARRIGAERDERRAVVVGGPPGAGHQCRILW